MSEKVNRFRLFEVVSGGKKSGEDSNEVKRYPVQATLFPIQQDRLVIFVPLPGVSEEDFVSVICATKPAYVIDLRPVPRFDIGQLNREIVFQLFRKQQSTYLDQGESRVEKHQRGKWLEPTTALLKGNTRGPVMLLVSGLQNREGLREAIIGGLDSTDGDWQVYDVPRSAVGRLELCSASD